MKRKAFVYNIDRISYLDALNLQHKFHNMCVEGEIPGILMLLEHDPVITMGVKSSSAGNVLASAEVLKRNKVELVETDRGGDVTYHGPGQLVGYPIFKLRELGGDLHGYLRDLEDCIINMLSEFGLKGGRNGPAGVWVGDKKLCSIGVAIRRWVTYHGFAFNVNPNLNHFSLINPCGLQSEQISSLVELMENPQDMKTVKEICARSFEKVFDIELEEWPGETQ